MNRNYFFNKWWLMMFQGALLVLLSYFLFSQTDKAISASGVITGFIAMITGSVSIIGFYLAGKNEKNKIDVWCGFFCCIAGLFFLSGTGVAHHLISWFIAAYMIFNVTMLIAVSLHLKIEISWWWYSVIFLLYTILVLFFLMSGLTILGISINVFAGVQFFVNGILVIVFAFVIRKIQQEYNKTIEQIRKFED